MERAFGASFAPGLMGLSIAIDVTPFLASRTGVGVCVASLAGELLSASGGNRFVLCAVSARGTARAVLRRRFPDSEIRVRRLPVKLLSPLVDGTAWLRAETIFGPSDVFHASQTVVPPSSRAAIVVTVYDLTPVRFPEFHLRSNLFGAQQLKNRLGRADLVLVPSVSTGADLEGLELVSGSKVRVVPLAADRRFRPEVEGGRATLASLGVEGEFLLNVGALEPRKNLPRLFQAFRLLKDRHRIPHKLIVAGPRGWKDEEIFESVRRTGLSDSIVFTGYLPIETLNLLYSHASLLVYPSLYEGFGLPPLEAMSACCPVAVARTSSLPEIVGHAGVYFDPLEVEDMAQAIHGVLSSPALRAKLVELGTVQARQFSWEKTAESTLEVYEEAARLKAGG